MTRDNIISMKYSLLTSRVALALKRYMRDGKVEPRELKFIEAGIDFLDKVISSSNFITKSGNRSQLPPSRDDLYVYGRTLDAMVKLEIAPTEAYTNTFQDYHDSLSTLINNKQIEEGKLILLADIFDVISEHFN